MIRRIISIILVAVLALSCASGCTQDPVQSNGVAVKQELTLDTAAISSWGRVVETENGYYYSDFNGLIYADKSDLTNWVLVCNDPTCEHILSSCPAKVFGGIAMVNGRILTLRNTDVFELEGPSGFGVYSMAPDGTDLQLEYFIEESIGVNNGSHMSAFSDGQGTFYCGMSIMQTDGTYLSSIVKATADSSTVLAETVKNDMSIYVATHASSMRGDAALRTDLFVTTEEDNRQLCRISGSELEDISQAEQYGPQGGFLSGDDLYRFEKNKGYYLTDLTTGQSQKWMEPQLQDSRAWHLTNQWIVETNADYFQPPEVPELKIYNGSDWKTVALPPDVLNQPETSFVPQALTTEHIFFTVDDHTLYYVDLTEETYTFTLAKDFHLTEPISWAAENS